MNIQQATLAARKRLNDGAIATSVHRGKIQIVRVEYTDGDQSLVTPLSQWMPLPDVVGALESLSYLKFRNVVDAGDEHSRFMLVENRGDRGLFVCINSGMSIAPTAVYPTADLVPA